MKEVLGGVGSHFLILTKNLEKKIDRKTDNEPNTLYKASRVYIRSRKELTP